MAKPNYSNPQTRPPAIQATAIVYILLGVLSLGLRLYTRGYIKRLFGTDDAFMIASTVFAVAMYTAALIASLCFGVNRHTVDIPPAMLYKLEKTNYIYNFFFVEATYMSKLSLLWFSWRLVGNALNYGFDLRRLALGFLFVFAVVCDITYTVVALLGCRPLKATWDPSVNYPHKCINIGVFMMVAGIINTMTDLCCTLLPASIVLQLQMPVRQRVAIASLFLFGLSVNIASALRIYYSFHQFITDDMWDMMQPYIAGNTEIGLGLLCVNAPAIRPLFIRATFRLSALCSSSYTHHKPKHSYSSGPSGSGSNLRKHPLHRTPSPLNPRIPLGLPRSLGVEGWSVTRVEGGSGSVRSNVRGSVRSSVRSGNGRGRGCGGRAAAAAAQEAQVQMEQEQAAEGKVPREHGIEVLQTVEMDSRTEEMELGMVDEEVDEEQPEAVVVAAAGGFWGARFGRRFRGGVARKTDLEEGFGR